MTLSSKIRERLERIEKEAIPPHLRAREEETEPASAPESRTFSLRARAEKSLPPLKLPVLSDRELEYKEQIHRRLLEAMDLSLLASLEPAQARGQIREAALRICEEISSPLTAEAKEKVVHRIEDEILGLGALEPLLAEPSVSDILVNGCRRVYVERFGRLELTPIRFANNEALMKIIDRIVSSVGRRVDESSPMVDARLKDGSRVNAVIPPLAIDGPVLSIRRFIRDRMSLDDLVVRKAMSKAMAQFLKLVVRARLNVLISGGTGTGKTTILNALSQFIPHNERIITIEDAAELQLKQDHVVRLETRPPNIEGKGEVTQRDLVKNALRMRPDRIVLGEVRGEEAFDMLQAMNTGHDGSLTTVHANTPRDALARIENMVSMTGFDLPVRAVRAQIASAIHVILQLERMEDGRRRIVSIAEIAGLEGEVITMSEIFRYERKGLDEDGNVLGEHRATGIVPRFNERFVKRGYETDLRWYDPDFRDES
jgi:pilus assembly protein CpaF